MCRWLERDPAGYQDGPSLYSYLGRNPMAGTDPYGLFYSGSGITVIAPDQIRPPVPAHELVQPPRYGLKLAAIWPGSPGYDEILAQAEALSAIARSNAERGVDYGLGFWDSLFLSDSPLHLTLQTIGLVPFVGEVADGLDALVYLAEGDPANASISALAMVPVIGAKATAARRAVKMADVVGETRKARGGATAVRKGQQGEAAVRAIRDIGPKKPIVVNGRRRIPDGMNRTTLTEIKNVKSLSYTQQLRDYADYANENGLVFELWMPRGVEMSRTLRDEIDAGRIVPQWIPGT
jgi:hypothetical protein